MRLTEEEQQTLMELHQMEEANELSDTNRKLMLDLEDKQAKDDKDATFLRNHPWWCPICRTTTGHPSPECPRHE